MNQHKEKLGSPLKTAEELREMTAQQRLEFFRGLIPDYNTRVNNTVQFALPSLMGREAHEQEKIREAFQLRVEDHLAEPGGSFGGSALDHLPQQGWTTEQEYEQLNLTAIALAATIINETGYAEYARSAFIKLGMLSAKNYIPVDRVEQR